MLVVTRKTEESVIIADHIEVTILEVAKDRVKIGISAPKDVKIIRNELLDTQNINEDSSREIPKETLESLFKFKKED
ncbi:MAG: carbon storage regulator [Ruminococcaceae bacterium]|nr:carbon storage regulator [Oscillospiraceae bacterium]MBD5116375.1 carbon storage regulator [Oscillospiraceae bacterium]